MMTYKKYRKARDELMTMSPELCEQMGIEADDDDMELMNMTEWPEFFEVDNVDHVRKCELKPKPKLNNFKSIENLL